MSSETTTRLKTTGLILLESGHPSPSLAVVATGIYVALHKRPC